jgi:FkbM family methyltransferase
VSGCPANWGNPNLNPIFWSAVFQFDLKLQCLSIGKAALSLPLNVETKGLKMNETDFHRALFCVGTLIDVGAHDGALAVPLSFLPGALLLAFEPLPPAFIRLEAAMRLAHGGDIPAHVRLRPEALGHAVGNLVLEVPVVGGAAQEQWASTVKDYTAMQRHDSGIEAVRRYNVPMLPLDHLNLVDVTGIKLDAEGAELEVLRGAVETLRRCRPVLSVEIEERHRAGSTKDVPAFLTELGYRGFYEFYGDWRPIEGFDPGTMQRASPSPAVFEASHPYVFCFYFVPPDRIPELAVLARLPSSS